MGGNCAPSDILTGGGGGGGGGVVPNSCATSPRFGSAICIETGQMRFAICSTVLADTLAITPSVQDVSMTVKGQVGNVFSVWNQGLRVELTADVATLTAVSTLISQNKAKVVGSFVGDNDKGA